MNQNLNCPKYKVYCQRNIIFKKYDREKSHLVRLDFNIDILPKEKGHFYQDKNGEKCQDVYYIDMSTIEFIIYNEDLKMCGNYDYNKEELHYYKLPLNERKCITNLDKKPTKKNERKEISLDKPSIKKDNKPKSIKKNTEYEEEDIMFKIALFESLNDLKNKEDKESTILNITENKEDKESMILNITENISQKYENSSLSGIKAEERQVKHNSKYNKQKNIEKKVIFQDNEMRKLLT
jgi:hypothetical protein